MTSAFSVHSRKEDSPDKTVSEKAEINFCSTGGICLAGTPPEKRSVTFFFPSLFHESLNATKSFVLVQALVDGFLSYFLPQN
jgi:hypothetical protein